MQPCSQETIRPTQNWRRIPQALRVRTIVQQILPAPTGCLHDQNRPKFGKSCLDVNERSKNIKNNKR